MRGVDEEAAPFIYEVISVRFNFNVAPYFQLKKKKTYFIFI